jgi:hypothetical protein
LSSAASRALLDVNVLIALLDQDHVHHETAWAWLQAEGSDGWATCAVTQNGFVRVLSSPRYPNAVTTAEAAGLLRQACMSPEHMFWRCTTSFLDPAAVDPRRVHGPAQITDTYLLALAVAEAGRLVTFDRTIALSAVPGATPEHILTL